ncbi:hypothetical protein HDV00_005191 [Rhizophlyctis rosea]|nr:hypothetical protein HDV00_005191 [Rhizophlyctis rosea]
MALELASLVVGILGLIPSVIQLFTNTSNNLQTQVHVGIQNYRGADGGLLNSPDGPWPSLHMYDSANSQIGWDCPPGSYGSIGSGGTATYSTSIYNNQKVRYLTVEGASDAICISEVRYKQNDGVVGLFVGDVFHKCNRPWYYSGNWLDNANGPVYLQCGWLQYNSGTASMPSQIRMDLSLYTDGGLRTNPDLCNSGVTQFNRGPQRCTRFGKRADNATVSDDAVVPATTFTADDAKAFSAKFSYMITDDELSATDLCNSPSSAGPIFISTKEQTVCVLETKELIPFCQKSGDKDCFDTKKGKFLHDKYAKHNAKTIEKLVKQKKN